MKLRRFLTGSIVLLAIQAALANPAMAAVLEGGADTAITRCAGLIEPALDTPQAWAATPLISKSASILGGQVSQLDLIAMQQAGGNPAPQGLIAPAPAPAETGTPGEGLEPASGGSACPGFTGSGFARLQTSPVLGASVTGRSPLGADDFLASKRLPIKRTAFDAAWSRVRNASLPRDLLRGLREAGGGAATLQGIAAINSWTNAKVRYVEDREQYGQNDFWANARTTLQRRAGDCEDIAIAKMQLLAAMGIPRDDIYLTVAKDLARGADHALLVVRFEGRYLLLDNSTNELLDAANSYDYRPIMSFSTAGKWLHGY